MDTDNRELLILRVTGAHLRYRAPKHENKPEAKKDFADDSCFHVIYFLSLFWPSLISRH
jgi:hypothetical protein